MATLTWQDVAGQVRAPDYSDATAAITRGIEGIGSAVQGIASAPTEREEARIMSQMVLAATGQKFLDANTLKAEKNEDKARKLLEETSMKEFGAAQSILEAGFRNAALNGQSYDDFTKSSEAYLGLSEGARAYGASHMSDAYLRGDETRITMRERAADNARQQANADRSYGLQQQQAARSAASHNAQMRAYKRVEDEADRVKKETGPVSDDPETNRAYDYLFRRAGMQHMDATGAAYADESLSELQKLAGFEDISGATAAFAQFNQDRVKGGKSPLPETVFKGMIASQVGKNGWFTGMARDMDPQEFGEQLPVWASKYDAAENEVANLIRQRERIASGERLTMPGFEDEFARMAPEVQSGGSGGWLDRGGQASSAPMPSWALPNYGTK